MRYPEQPDARDSEGLAILDREECLRLLAGTSVGRLVFTEHALPAITPVNFVIHDDAILIPLDQRGNLAAAAEGVVVAFEADEFDAVARAGWSVTVVGRATRVTDGASAGKLGALSLDQRASVGRHFIKIQVVHITGRRIDSVAR